MERVLVDVQTTGTELTELEDETMSLQPVEIIDRLHSIITDTFNSVMLQIETNNLLPDKNLHIKIMELKVTVYQISQYVSINYDRHDRIPFHILISRVNQLHKINNFIRELSALLDNFVSGQLLRRSKVIEYRNGIVQHGSLVGRQMVNVLCSAKRLMEQNPSKSTYGVTLSAILEDCPDNRCAVCVDQKATEETEFAILKDCRHIFCILCITTWFMTSR